MSKNEQDLHISPKTSGDNPEGALEEAQDGLQLPAVDRPPSDNWWSDTKIWINVAGYISVTATLIVLQVRPDILPSTERGFHCNDADLQFPKKPESIPFSTLIVSTVSIFLLSVFISEGLYAVTPEYIGPRSQDNMLGAGGEKEGGGPLKDKVFLFINLVTSKLLYGYLGLILTMTFTYHIQHVTSAFRPDFLLVCNPKPLHCATNAVAYFVHCQQTDKDLLLDSRLSFPSEYASISFYLVVFAAMIIERAISTEFFALKVAVQSSYLLWAIYVTCSRLKDNKNHPVDCMAGVLLGSSIAYFMDTLANYADYDWGYYDPNITLNIQDWEEGMDRPIGQPDYKFP